ncbi:spore germination protein GerPC [Gorillibacterium sp. sgz5001074]|uniref:spore germination protein GerPC n=1 Tax=Gorillibacterium sp. sgz5001074 TaxID=3446695 RepID=UPI003F674D16
MEPQLLWHLQELLRRTGWLAEQQLRMERQLQDMGERLAAVEVHLHAVEVSLASVQKQLEEQEKQPTTRIDKIEYRFEQLKVDTLAGTLQIGLAQGADGLIEDLAAGSATAQDVKLSSGDDDGDENGGGDRGEPYASMGRALEGYLAAELDQDIDAAAEEAGMAPAEARREEVAEDLRRQIRQRAAVYMKQIPTREGSDEAAVRTMLERVRKDVREGLAQFYKQEGKGQEP